MRPDPDLDFPDDWPDPEQPELDDPDLDQEYSDRLDERLAQLARRDMILHEERRPG